MVPSSTVVVRRGGTLRNAVHIPQVMSRRIRGKHVETSRSPGGDALRNAVPSAASPRQVEASHSGFLEDRVDDRVTELGNLRSDNTHLHETMRSGAVVDHAIAVVVALGQLAPEQAEHILQELARHTGIKLRHVAQLLIEWTRTGRLCADLRTELDRQLAGHTKSPQVGV